MKTEAERTEVKHKDEVEELLTRHSKELEDAGLFSSAIVIFLSYRSSPSSC